MNKNELKAEMIRHGDTSQTLAAALGRTSRAFSMKINGKRSFTQAEIQVIVDRYQLDAEEIQRIFFSLEVS